MIIGNTFNAKIYSSLFIIEPKRNEVPAVVESIIAINISPIFSKNILTNGTFRIQIPIKSCAVKAVITVLQGIFFLSILIMYDIKIKIKIPGIALIKENRLNPAWGIISIF